MTKQECKIDQLVVRDQGSHTNYTSGRIGTIIEIADIDDRVRVLWTRNKEGKPIPNIKTWMKVSTIKPVI